MKPLANGSNGNGSSGRIEFLKQKLEADRAALAAEMLKRAKRENRELKKEDSILGGAVRKAAGESLEFRLMICQTALCNVAEIERRFLADRGWK